MAKRAVAYDVPESWISYELGKPNFSLVFPEYDDAGHSTGKTCRVMGIPIERPGKDGKPIKTVSHKYEFVTDPTTKKRELDRSKPVEGLCNVGFGYAEKGNGEPFCFFVRKTGDKKSERVPVNTIVEMINNTKAGMEAEAKRRMIFGDDEPAAAKIPQSIEEDTSYEYDGDEDEPTLPNE